MNNVIRNNSSNPPHHVGLAHQLCSEQPVKLVAVDAPADILERRAACHKIECFCPWQVQHIAAIPSGRQSSRSLFGEYDDTFKSMQNTGSQSSSLSNHAESSTGSHHTVEDAPEDTAANQQRYFNTLLEAEDSPETRLALDHELPEDRFTSLEELVMHNEVRIRTSLAVRYKYPLTVPTADPRDRFARLKKLQVLIRDHRPNASDPQKPSINKADFSLKSLTSALRTLHGPRIASPEPILPESWVKTFDPSDSPAMSGVCVLLLSTKPLHPSQVLSAGHSPLLHRSYLLLDLGPSHSLHESLPASRPAQLELTASQPDSELLHTTPRISIPSSSFLAYYVSASFWPGYPSPDASQSVECGNTNAAVGINVGNDINCQVNQGDNASPYPTPYPNPYVVTPGYNPGSTTAQDVNCGNSVGGVIVNVGDRVNCEVNQGNGDSYPYNPYGWSPYPYQAKEVKDTKKKQDHNSLDRSSRSSSGRPDVERSLCLSGTTSVQIPFPFYPVLKSSSFLLLFMHPKLLRTSFL
ncbi:hypothetical protein PCASD_05510 [Puccinia coronata f. sp. avenae]|uniref:Uncharacterized protein n=1 Tax=Puccinia coronata f. sp. avenae TaxID=200324 RepID=A0A2N5UVY7_9BASI|nr:hypothetical protein PCASD_05510 [Puccinia coronata f. sp. avenae]